MTRQVWKTGERVQEWKFSKVMTIVWTQVELWITFRRGMQVIVAMIISRSERLGCVLRSSSFAQGLYGIANPSEVEK